MGRRTEIQLALLFIGLVALGIGIRRDDERLRIAGIAFFAGATLMRFLKRRPPDEG